MFTEKIFWVSKLLQQKLGEIRLDNLTMQKRSLHYMQASFCYAVFIKVDFSGINGELNSKSMFGKTMSSIFLLKML